MRIMSKTILWISPPERWVPILTPILKKFMKRIIWFSFSPSCPGFHATFIINICFHNCLISHCFFIVWKDHIPSCCMLYVSIVPDCFSSTVCFINDKWLCTIMLALISSNTTTPSTRTSSAVERLREFYDLNSDYNFIGNPKSVKVLHLNFFTWKSSLELVYLNYFTWILHKNYFTSCPSLELFQ